MATIKKQLKKRVKAVKKKDPIEAAFEEGRVLSTGNTLLDLSCSGKRFRDGGVPVGIFIEIFGPEASGKTGLLSELAASCQTRGGDVKFGDPEYRFNKKYAEKYGFKIKKKNLIYPDTVTELFDSIWDWKPETTKPGAINLYCGDSLASLSTDMEIEKKDGDKRGQRRAKEFSQELRKIARFLGGSDLILACSNQERTGDNGQPITPGGKAIPYYASLRIRLTPKYPTTKIEQKKTVGKKKVNKVIGIWATAEIKKSSIDDPFRTCNIPFIFGYGIDDIAGNLQWLKEIYGNTLYPCFGKEIKGLFDAVQYIEEENLEQDLKEQVIKEWHEIQQSFERPRKKKVRI